MSGSALVFSNCSVSENEYFGAESIDKTGDLNVDGSPFLSRSVGYINVTLD
jgi:hypothetical protein